MFDKFDDLYVLDIIEPMIVVGSSFEEAEVFKNCICRKEITSDGKVIYRDINRDRVFYVSDKIGVSRVDVNSIVPISKYYNFFGIPRLINGLDNKKSVKSKVRTLKREGKL